MAYLKGVLATVASLFLALLVPQLWWLIRGLTTEKATGFTVVAAGFLESILSPWFWILAVLFSAFFYFSSGFENKSLRVVLSGFPLSSCHSAVSDSGPCSRFWLVDSRQAKVREPPAPKTASHSQNKYSAPCRQPDPHHPAAPHSSSARPADCTAPAENIHAAETT